MYKLEDVEIVKSEALSTRYDTRFVILDKSTGEIIDDAQGYGYKSQQKARAAFLYKNEDPKKKAEKEARYNNVRKWMKAHKSFVRALDGFAFEMAKGSWGPNDKVDAKFVKEMLKENGLEFDGFTVRDFLYVWRKG